MTTVPLIALAVVCFVVATVVAVPALDEDGGQGWLSFNLPMTIALISGLLLMITAWLLSPRK